MNYKFYIAHGQKLSNKAKFETHSKFSEGRRQLAVFIIFALVFISPVPDMFQII